MILILRLLSKGRGSSPVDGSTKDQCEELFARFMPFPHLCSGHGQIDLWACFMMDHPGIVILECARQGEVCLSKHLQWWLFVSRKQPLMDFEAKTLSSEHQDSIKLNYLLLIDSYLWTVVKVWWRWKQVCLAPEEKDMTVNFSSSSYTQVKSHE